MKGSVEEQEDWTLACDLDGNTRSATSYCVTLGKLFDQAEALSLSSLNWEW